MRGPFDDFTEIELYLLQFARVRYLTGELR